MTFIRGFLIFFVFIFIVLCINVAMMGFVFVKYLIMQFVEKKEINKMKNEKIKVFEEKGVLNG